MSVYILIEVQMYLFALYESQSNRHMLIIRLNTISIDFHMHVYKHAYIHTHIHIGFVCMYVHASMRISKYAHNILYLFVVLYKT